MHTHLQHLLQNVTRFSNVQSDLAVHIGFLPVWYPCTTFHAMMSSSQHHCIAVHVRLSCLTSTGADTHQILPFLHLSPVQLHFHLMAKRLLLPASSALHRFLAYMAAIRRHDLH